MEAGQPGTRAAELRDLLTAYGAEAVAIDALEALARCGCDEDEWLARYAGTGGRRGCRGAALHARGTRLEVVIGGAALSQQIGHVDDYISRARLGKAA